MPQNVISCHSFMSVYIAFATKTHCFVPYTPIMVKNRKIYLATRQAMRNSANYLDFHHFLCLAPKYDVVGSSLCCIPISELIWSLHKYAVLLELYMMLRQLEDQLELSRHLIPAPIDRTSASAWLYKHPWITHQNISKAHQ